MSSQQDVERSRVCRISIGIENTTMWHEPEKTSLNASLCHYKKSPQFLKTYVKINLLGESFLQYKPCICMKYTCHVLACYPRQSQKRWHEPLINLNKYMGVSKNSATPKSSILIGSSIINHPFWGTPNFWKHPYRI